MSTSWTLALMVELLLVLLAWFGTVQFGSWLAPGAFYSILWAGFVGASLVFAPDNEIWPGVVWFLLMCGLVQIGAAIGSGSARRPMPLRRGSPSLRALRWTNVFCVIAGLVGVEILLRSIGEGLTSLANPVALAINSVVFSYLRYYRHGFREPSAYVALSTLVYLSAYLSGILFSLSQRRADRVIAILVAAPVLLIGITLTTRGPVLFCGIMWLVSYLVTGVWSGEITRLRFGARSLTWAGVLSAILVVVYVGLQALRTGAPIRRDAKFNPVQFGLAQAQTAYVGSLAAFSSWFEDNWSSFPAPGLGRYSFASAYQWLGGGHQFQRFDETQVSSEDPDAPTTNVFTIYRYWAEDFTLPGSAFLVLLLGVMGGWSYRSVQNGAFSRVPFLALFYQIGFVSLAGFAMRDTTIQGAFLLLLVFARFGRAAPPRRRAKAPGGEAIAAAG